MMKRGLALLILLLCDISNAGIIMHGSRGGVIEPGSECDGDWAIGTWDAGDWEVGTWAC